MAEENFSAVNKTLKETVVHLKENAAKEAEEAAKTRAVLEKTAASTIGGGVTTKERSDAKKTLEKQDEANALASENKSATMKLLGISQKRMDKADKLNVQIEAQEKTMSEQKALIEASGLNAEKVPKFQKAQIKLDELKAKKDKTMGAAASEDDAKAGAKDKKTNTLLGKIAGGISGIAKQGMQKVKSGLGGFSKFLFGALAVAALAFLDHPKFKEMISLLVDTLIPLAVTFYEEVLVPVGAALAKLFKDIMGYLKDGKPSLMSILMDNKLAILGIITALAPNLVFGGLKLAVMGIGKALLWASAKSGLTALIMKGLTAVKVGFVAMKASVLGFMTPLLPIIAIAAGIALVLYSLKQAFDDFMFELEATGSIWEATKTAIVSVISNILGLPFDLLKDGVSWILGKIGSVFGLESFTNASKVLDDFSFVDMITDMLTFLGDSISGIFDGFMQSIQDFLRGGLLGKFGGSTVADKLFGTKEEQEEKIKAKEEEQKQFELNRKALREKQKLEKEIEEAKKLEKIKAEKNALQTGAPANPNLDPSNYMFAPPPSNIISAPTSVVNANSSSHTSTSTPVRQPNMVIGQLASSY